MRYGGITDCTCSRPYYLRMSDIVLERIRDTSFLFLLYWRLISYSTASLSYSTRGLPSARETQMETKKEIRKPSVNPCQIFFVKIRSYFLSFRSCNSRLAWTGVASFGFRPGGGRNGECSPVGGRTFFDI